MARPKKYPREVQVDELCFEVRRHEETGAVRVLMHDVPTVLSTQDVEGVCKIIKSMAENRIAALPRIVQ